MNAPTTYPRPSGGTNAVGLVRVRLLALADLAHVEPPAPGSQTLASGAVVLLSGRYPLDLTWGNLEAAFVEEQTESQHGVTYKAGLTVVLPKDTPTAGALMEPVTGHVWLALCQDANGVCRLVGTMEQPLRLTQRVEVGRNARTLALATETCHPAYYAAGIDDNFLSGDGLVATAQFGATFDI